MADVDNRTLAMNNGDFILLPADADGTVRHMTIDGAMAFGQRISNRLLAVKGESPWDATIGLPHANLSDLGTPAVFASLAAEAIRPDTEVQSILGVEFVPQTEAQFQNGEMEVVISVARNTGERVLVRTTVT